jgi:hypothetical protein
MQTEPKPNFFSVPQFGQIVLLFNFAKRLTLSSAAVMTLDDRCCAREAVTAVSSQQSAVSRRKRRQLQVAGMAMTQYLIHTQKGIQRLYHTRTMTQVIGMMTIPI